MKSALLIPLLLLFSVISSARAAGGSEEYIVLVGGPSLMEWEKYKGPAAHDHWWANFVRAARIRTEQLRQEHGADARITWLVYKQGYIDRGRQEKQDLLPFIASVRDKFNLNLVYFRDGADVIDYLNRGQPRSQVKVAFFEYFGHSNAACFMFDYSSNVDSASKSWLRDTDLAGIDRTIFTRGAEIRSWGCYTGLRMAKAWHNAIGNRMWGVTGKTQYMTDELPVIATAGARWTN